MNHKILNLRTGQVIASRAVIAQDFKSRSVGLLNRASLDQDEALLIRPCNSIHMFFMKFSIDVVYLDKLYRVVKIVQNLPPWRLSSCLFKAFMTLEIPSGSSTTKDIKVGDTLKIEQ